MILRSIIALICFIVVLSPNAVLAQTQSFDAWLAQTKRDAAAQGISQGTINAALNEVNGSK